MNLKFTLAVLTSVFLISLIIGGCKLESDDALPTLNSSSSPYSIPFRQTEQMKQLSLENVFQVSERLFSGGEPKTEQAFDEIVQLGCKTIISVDGAKPNVVMARKHGLDYVHIPIGYDGLDRAAQLSIVNVIRSAQGPYYFHCHHGKHRGPAAVAIALMAELKCSNEVATQFMEAAGTSHDYDGLWRDIGQFELPDEGTELPALRSIAEVDSFVESMAVLDRAFDELKLCRQADWQPPSDHPDLVPRSLATIVREGFAECKRLAREDWPDEFIQWLDNSDNQASQLEKGLRDNDRPTIESAFESLSNGCLECHQKYRN